MPWPRSGPAAAGTRGTRRIRKPSAFTPLVLLFAGEGEGGCVGKGRRLRPIGSSVDPSMQILDPEFEVRLELRIEDLHGRVHRGAYRPQPPSFTDAPAFAFAGK